MVSVIKRLGAGCVWRTSSIQNGRYLEPNVARPISIPLLRIKHKKVMQNGGILLT